MTNTKKNKKKQLGQVMTNDKQQRTRKGSLIVTKDNT